MKPPKYKNKTAVWMISVYWVRKGVYGTDKRMCKNWNEAKAEVDRLKALGYGMKGTSQIHVTYTTKKDWEFDFPPEQCRPPKEHSNV